LKLFANISRFNIIFQARAPNSPVLIVGTHYDMMQENYPSSRAEDLQQLIRDRYVMIIFNLIVQFEICCQFK
jgi:hypothetical protein